MWFRLAAALGLLVAVPGAARAQPAPSQVLLIPISGELPEARSGLPARLTAVVGDAIRARGGEPVTAKVKAADIAAIAGCPAESRECFDLIASTVEVDEVVFGTIAPADSGGGFDVVMTSVRPDEVPWQRRIHLRAGEDAEIAAELRPIVDRFLAREDPVQAPVRAPDFEVKAPVQEPPPAASAFSLGRVKPLSWGLTGGGLVLAGLGAYYLSRAADKQDELENAPDRTAADLERMKEIEDEGKQLNLTGNVLLIGGAVVAVAGIALGLRQAMSRPERSPISIAPVPAEEGVGLSIVIRGNL